MTASGKRSGAGRPVAPETKVITFRVRVEWEPKIRAVVKKEIEKLKKAVRK